ncbi:oxidoreductase [Setomelanomma holmii]|uniref:Oxidoreductase n=1 Tax=Setomelanomma holmii TaxID=210430 RepID=A0A9P4LIM7_9PLEO|nr:oxidoreductase [Setomelanomma holmii]
MAAQNSPTKKFHKTTYPSLDPARPELSAKGKTIVITGGGTGIGAETAVYFATAGAARIAILGRREQPLLDTKAALEADYPNTDIIAIATDVTKNSQVEAAFERIAGDSKIDVLCSNAAIIGAQGNIVDLRPDHWLEGILINLQGNFNVTKAFLGYAAKDAVIIETNSAAAHLDITAGFSAYNVAKMATARFFQCVQFEHPDLSVYSIQPGAVNTDMSREAGYKPQKEGEDFQWKGEGSSLLSGYDDASLPASFIVWLASPEARFLKGKYLWANWDVDELKARKEEIENSTLLSIGLQGWPFT